MARELTIRITADNADAHTKLAQTEKDITGVSHAAQATNVHVKETTGHVASIGAAAGTASPKVSGFFGAIKTSGTVLSTAFGGIVGGVIGGAVMGLVDNVGQMASRFFDGANAAQDLADRLGISAEAAQKWRFAIDQTGGSMGALASSAGFLFKTLGAGKDATAALVNSLTGPDGLHLSFEAIKAMKPEDAFTTIADAVGRIQDPMEQATVGAQLMGRGFATNLGAMEQGFVKLGEEAKTAGAIMSNETVAAADEMGDTFGKLKDVGLSLLATVFMPLVPVITDLLQIVVEILKPLGMLLEVALKPIGLALGIVSEGIKLVVQWVGNLFKPVDEANEALGSFWSWLAEKIAPVLTPVIGLLGDVKDMFFALGELVWAVHVKVIGAVAKMVGDVVMWIVTKLKPIFAPLMPVIEAVATVFGKVKDGAILAAKLLYEGVKLWLIDRFTSIIDGAREKIQAVTGFFRNMYEEVVGHSIVPDMINQVGDWFEKLDDKVVKPTRSAMSDVERAFSDMKQAVTTTIGDAFASWIGHASSFKSIFGQMFKDLRSELANIFSGIASDFVSRTINGILSALSGGSFTSAFSGFLGGGAGVGGSVAGGAGGIGSGVAGSIAGGALSGVVFMEALAPGFFKQAFTDFWGHSEGDPRQGIIDGMNYTGISDPYEYGRQFGIPDDEIRRAGFSLGTFGQYGAFGSGTPATLHGHEAVVPRAYTPTLAEDISEHMGGGGQPVNVTFNVNNPTFRNREDMRQMARQFARPLAEAVGHFALDRL